ncbi:klc-2 [Symbiodinium sp. KB8]|nr:klc-2 [Symbiodinium sp. KB8]
MHHLAEVLQERGQLQEAEKLYRQVLLSRRASPGDSHPDTLSSMHDLATLLVKREQFGEAEELFREELEKRRRDKLGDEHADTMSSISDLATLLKEKEEWKEAEQLFCEKLLCGQSVHGTQHKETITATKKLAKFLKATSSNPRIFKLGGASLRNVSGR